MCTVICRNKRKFIKFNKLLWKHCDFLCSSLRKGPAKEGEVWDKEVNGKSGRQGTNEISQLWFDPSHVMAGSPPLSLSDFLTLSLLISRSLKSLSPGFSEQKEASTGGSPFSVTHEMKRAGQPLPSTSTLLHTLTLF